MSCFPLSRPRRLRRTSEIRNHIAQVTVLKSDFMYPIFVVHGNNIKKEIESMPGQYHWSLDRLHDLVDLLEDSGILSIMIFGIPNIKDIYGSENYSDDGIVQQAILLIKNILPRLIIATDVCLCSYTKNGHCGIIFEGEVNNDQTLNILQKTAVSHARSGADIIAPSGMMDGSVQAIRHSLDENRFFNVSIMSYSIKYASAFYGPFRSACNSTPEGDRKTYQMDYRNLSDAVREVEMDEKEGADILIVKPAMSYLDIIQTVKSKVNLPIAAYQVSGEYALIKSASEKNWIDERAVVMETLTSIKRAGAKIILTYYALNAAKWIEEI
jgi:porphobilinogen synthase